MRPEYKYIVDWIPPKSTVLDLGCGDGQLMELITEQKECSVFGVDISWKNVESVVEKGLEVSCGDIDDEKIYKGFYDDSYDYVIVNVTLQMIHRPNLVIEQSLRIGKRVIFSFPNFGHWVSRMELLLLGRFPRKPLYGYRWYNTKHIHLFSYSDFLGFVKNKVKVENKICFGMDDKTPSVLSNLYPNLFATEVIIECQKSKIVK